MVLPLTSKSYRDAYKIREGRITLYRRTHQGTNHQSDNWYAAFRIPGHKTIRRSLKTDNQTEAEQLAESQYFELFQKASKGLALNSKPFPSIAEALLQDFEENVQRESSLPRHEQSYKADRLKNKKLIVTKFLIPFFGSRPIQEITDLDVEKYKEWRKKYWVKGEGSLQKSITYIRNGRRVTRPRRQSEKTPPSYSTVNKELTVLRQIFEFARLSSFIEGREIPVVKNLSKPRNYRDRKPGVTFNQLEALLINLAERHQSESNSKHKLYINLLISYISFMSLTGLRVSEAKNVRMSDCEILHKDEQEFLKIFVRAKGKSRELISLRHADTVLNAIESYHRKNAKKNNWTYSPSTYLFTDQYGQRINSFASGLSRAFEDAGLLRDKHGVKRTAGAFRKYYITQALLNEVDYLKLARQCGTSVNVIEKYYADIEPHQIPETFVFPNELSEMFDNHD